MYMTKPELPWIPRCISFVSILHCWRYEPESETCPIANFFGNILICLSVLHNFRGHAHHRGSWWHIPVHQTICGDACIVSDFNAPDDDGSRTDHHIVAKPRDTGAPESGGADRDL